MKEKICSKDVYFISIQLCTHVNLGIENKITPENRLNTINEDAVKRLEDQEDEMEQKGADLVEKNSLVKTLEQEVEEYKVIVQEYKEKLKQIEDHHRKNMEETKIPEKKRK